MQKDQICQSILSNLMEKIEFEEPTILSPFYPLLLVNLCEIQVDTTALRRISRMYYPMQYLDYCLLFKVKDEILKTPEKLYSQLLSIPLDSLYEEKILRLSINFVTSCPDDSFIRTLLSLTYDEKAVFKLYKVLHYSDKLSHLLRFMDECYSIYESVKSEEYKAELEIVTRSFTTNFMNNTSNLANTWRYLMQFSISVGSLLLKEIQLNNFLK